MAHSVHNCALFLIQQPNPMPSGSLPLSLGLLHYNRVASHRVGSGHITSGRVTLCQVGSHHVGSHRIASGRSRYNRVSHATIRSVRQVGRTTIGSVRQVGRTTIRLVMLQSGWAHCYRVGRAIIGPSWCAFPPCFCSAPLHTLPPHSLRRISLYLHTSLFSFCHCDPGHLSLALALPYPCHLSLRYFWHYCSSLSLWFSI